jgi:hypothetical protein
MRYIHLDELRVINDYTLRDCEDILIISSLITQINRHVEEDYQKESNWLHEYMLKRKVSVLNKVLRKYNVSITY